MDQPGTIRPSKSKRSWYDIIIYAVMTLAGAAIGAFVFVNVKKSRAVRPSRDANFNTLVNKVVPIARREMARYPDKDMGMIISMADRSDSTTLSFTNSDVIIRSRDEEITRLN